MSEKMSAVETRERSQSAPCRHHWVIESPHGATSMGVCKFCGARREFYNSTPDALWESDSLADLSSSPWRRASTSAPDDDELSTAPGDDTAEVALVL